jgi:hypothetical protein
MKAQAKSLFLGLLVFCFLGTGSISSLSPDALSCIWTVSKSANVSTLTLAPGQQFIVNYSISVDVAPGSICIPYPVDYADVYDTNMVSPAAPDGYIGSVYYGTDTLPKVFAYSKIIGPFNTCGEYSVENTATLCTGASCTWPIYINVPCGGCTLTPGYWKTHSEFGPAPYDDTWAQLSSGANTPFFLSGQSWYEVLWTPPIGGDAYYILAHAFIATQLNIMNGAAVIPEVSEAISWAETFFNSFSPSFILPKALSNQAKSYAKTLDNYNNGLIGPGHCSE